MNIVYLLAKLIKKIHLPAIKNSYIHKTSKVCSGSHIVDSKMDKYSYIGNFCTIIETDIGSFCSIADNCIIGGANHPITWASTSPVFHEGKNILKKNFSNHKLTPRKRTLIENDVWIGNNCLIKSGISIANGSVIGMGSVVTKNVGAYEIWAGNPAKLIKKRFDDEIIEKLNKSQWWNNSDKNIEIFARYTNDIGKLLYNYEEAIEWKKY